MGRSERGIGFLFTECDGVFVPTVGQAVGAGGWGWGGQREGLGSCSLSVTVCLSPGWDRLWEQGGPGGLGGAGGCGGDGARGRIRVDAVIFRGQLPPNSKVNTYNGTTHYQVSLPISKVRTITAGIPPFIFFWCGSRGFFFGSGAYDGEFDKH